MEKLTLQVRMHAVGDFLLGLNDDAEVRAEARFGAPGDPTSAIRVVGFLETWLTRQVSLVSSDLGHE